MDLLSLAIVLRPLQQVDPEKPSLQWWGRPAHHLLLEILKLENEQLGASAHEGSELRPFTTSTLYGNFPKYQLELDGSYLLRFTGLNTSVSQTLLASTQAGGALEPGAVVNLNYLDFQVQKIYFENGSHPLAEHATYQDLANAALLNSEPAPRRIGFNFASPTTFRRNGRQIPYPLPELVIGSLLEKWNAFAPVGFPEEARQYANECLVLGKFELKSRRVGMAGGLQNGVVGVAIFNTTNYDRYWMSIMQTLSLFSYYSGVGAKTTMGMGQCRRSVESERNMA